MRGSPDDPIREGARLRARLRDLLDATFVETQRSGPAVPWVPRADIWSTPEAVIVEVEVPGLEADDVEAHVEGNVLTIAGSRPATRDAGQYLERQRPEGAFSRAFTLTGAPRDVEARLEDGLLTVTLRR